MTEPVDIRPNPTPTRRGLTAGGEIDAWCTRCKLDLGHRIVALVGVTPKRVVCMTCSSEHNFRPARSAQKGTPRMPRAEKSASTAKKTSSGASKTTASSPGRKALQAKQEWESRVRSGKPFRRYSIDDHFEEGDLVQHKKFGEGYVVEVLGGGKLTVAFSDGERTLVHAPAG